MSFKNTRFPEVLSLKRFISLVKVMWSFSRQRIPRRFTTAKPLISFSTEPVQFAEETRFASVHGKNGTAVAFCGTETFS